MSAPVEERLSMDDDGELPKAAKSQLYKTEMCKSYMERGVCRYGSKCQFAHGTEELRTTLKHPKYKTIKCKTFWKIGSCPYGTRCRFLHAEDEADYVSLDGAADSSSSPEAGPVQAPYPGSPFQTPAQHPKYKTEMCISWSKYKSCSYGSRCRFVHGEDDPLIQNTSFPPPPPQQPHRRASRAGDSPAKFASSPLISAPTQGRMPSLSLGSEMDCWSTSPLAPPMKPFPPLPQDSALFSRSAPSSDGPMFPAERGKGSANAYAARNRSANNGRRGDESTAGSDTSSSSHTSDNVISAIPPFLATSQRTVDTTIEPDGLLARKFASHSLSPSVVGSPLLAPHSLPVSYEARRSNSLSDENRLSVFQSIWRT